MRIVLLFISLMVACRCQKCLWNKRIFPPSMTNGSGVKFLALVHVISVLAGLNLALFRDDQGIAHILDAFCPHNGAHLAIGGRVFGNCLECPFHGWKFRGDDGQCTHIPYSENNVIPPSAKVKSWPVLELNGWIYMWYHAEGIEPTWTPPEIPQITSGDWVYRGRTEHYVNAHIEEIPENGADLAHLDIVHTPIFAAGVDLRFMWKKIWQHVKHEWVARWDAHAPPNGHIGSLRLTQSIKIFGKKCPGITVSVEAQQIGPGIVYMFLESMVGNGCYIMSLTPTEPLVQKMVHNIYATWTMPTVIAKFFMMGEAIHVERDIMVWNNKRYEGRPLFVKSKEDALIKKHRTWYSQFYSKNSPKLKFQKDTLQW